MGRLLSHSFMATSRPYSQLGWWLLVIDYWQPARAWGWDIMTEANWMVLVSEGEGEADIVTVETLFGAGISFDDLSKCVRIYCCIASFVGNWFFGLSS
jgi:hypothetical protein